MALRLFSAEKTVPPQTEPTGAAVASPQSEAPVAKGDTATRVKLNPLWANLFRARSSKEAEDKETLELLKRIPLFEELSRRELAAVTRILYKRTYQSDEFVFHQDEPGLGMYIIVRGKVDIVIQPNQHPLAELHDGDFFGELALLDELPRSASALARTPATILGLFQPDFFDLIERYPRLGVKVVLRLARMVGRRLRVSDDRTRAMQEIINPA